jgi:hypothetical protein
MPSLLEAAASLAISAAVLVLMTASLAGAARVHAACIELGDELFRVRQLEHLVDRAASLAGAGPTHPWPVSSLTADTVVFASDQDGNGTVDATSSETTALEVRQSGSQARVRIRLGRQTMTVLEVDDSDASLHACDSRGRSAAASTTSLVELAIAARDDGSGSIRRLLFAVPARRAP